MDATKNAATAAPPQVEDTAGESLTTGLELTPTTFRAAREYMGLTLDEMRTRLGVSQVAVRKWESGERALPDGVTEETGQLFQGFAALVETVRTSDPLELPATGERGGWPPRSWRHAAIIAGRFDAVYSDELTYVETKCAQIWRRMKGAPEAWRGLADWADENRGDTTLAVLITQSGQIVGEARREHTSDGGARYRATAETVKRWQLDRTVADFAVAAIERDTGERVAMIPLEHVTTGQLRGQHRNNPPCAL